MRAPITALLLATLLMPAPAILAATVTKPAVKAAPAKPAKAHAATPAQPVKVPPGKPVAAAKPTPAPLPPLEESAELAHVRGAFQFAFPVYEMMRTRANAIAKASAAGGPGVNHLYPRLTLSDAAAREVTTPNNDTLYSSAWLDLAKGPVTLTLPALPKRYHSAALMNLFTDNTTILGTRLGGTGGNVIIAGPDWSGATPEGVPVVRSATNDAWLLVRVLVNGPDDLVQAADAVKGFSIDASTAQPTPTQVTPTLNPDARTLLAVVNEALGRGSMAPADAARMAAFADIGIVPGDTGAFAKLSPEAQALWSRALPQLRAELRSGLGSPETVGGWSASAANTGAFGDDDLTRAKVALGGLAALPRQEAIYVTGRVDKDGEAFDGSKSAYYLHLPANMPIGAFWSLTLYAQEKDGRLFFTNTPTKRYAITDRTKYLHVDRNGSVELFLQTAKPYGERAVNWLPTPAGPFVLVFRAYLPRAGFLDGSFKLPAVEKAEAIPATEPKD